VDCSIATGLAYCGDKIKFGRDIKQAWGHNESIKVLFEESEGKKQTRSTKWRWGDNIKTELSWV
jgi:hypothetical protein